jgi:hypothetical protein
VRARAISACPFDAHDTARESCKETGGYWTGTTCKASKHSHPQHCNPGYAWSEDAGACQWDGGPGAGHKQHSKPSTAQQLQNIIEGIQNLKHKCTSGKNWNAQAKSCL